MKECNCKKWNEGIKELDRFVILGYTNNGIMYSAGEFLFCPWCGNKLNNKNGKSYCNEIKNNLENKNLI